MTPTDTSDSVILSSIEDHVGTISLNRPDVLNAFNLALARQFLATLDEFGRDDDVRAVVIRGAGRVFSAGGDIREMLSSVREGEDRAAYFRAPLSAFGEIVVALRQTPKPVLAAVHGAVAGVAFNAMLACDLKIATDKTRFTQAFIKIGLSPDGGGTWFLPRLVGYARASELVLLPTELDAATARAWGLINWVVPEEDFEARVKETAVRLATGPAAAMARAKALLDNAYEHDLAFHVEAERLAQVDNAASDDFEEGLTAFVEKREPCFG
ncbi:MAG: enoyl-CoA hydratase/isomerase family protein [Gemmatimonadota bacterium]|nr:MAG: enoyl-CoA hydratase/isomerase family protein [Gemmatimonadota bacterium]